jgi:hypothetical protein
LSSLLFLYVWRKYDRFELIKRRVEKEVKAKQRHEDEYQIIELEPVDDNNLFFSEFTRAIWLKYPSDWILEKPNFEFFYKLLENTELSEEGIKNFVNDQGITDYTQFWSADKTSLLAISINKNSGKTIDQQIKEQEGKTEREYLQPRYNFVTADSHY